MARDSYGNYIVKMLDEVLRIDALFDEMAPEGKMWWCSWEHMKVEQCRRIYYEVKGDWCSI